MTSDTAPVHFLLRVASLTRVEGYSALIIDTIDAHSKVLEAKGCVSIGKFGASGPTHRVDKLKKQIQDGARTYLILVTQGRHTKEKKYLGFKAEISSITLGAPTDEIRNAAPSYYRQLGYAARLWFMVQSPLTICELTRVRLASSKKPVLDVLTKSRTPSMLVEIATSRAGTPAQQS